ncbi:hypothetical protein [Aureimonas sp. AU12]|uniref:hypothetical protein n=1 Tax=Aureimonas sp. AU12 TaxID=1638161 RepID=UPI000780690E|nr:hypothetical protein [Aureimonas sp. AU12]
MSVSFVHKGETLEADEYVPFSHTAGLVPLSEIAGGRFVILASIDSPAAELRWAIRCARKRGWPVVVLAEMPA